MSLDPSSLEADGGPDAQSEDVVDEADSAYISTLLAYISAVPAFEGILNRLDLFLQGSESVTEYDGPVSYVGEANAAVAGLSTGFTLVASGQLKILGGVWTATVFGNRGKKFYDASLLSDIRAEKLHFAAFLVLGGLLGYAARTYAAGLPEVV